MVDEVRVNHFVSIHEGKIEVTFPGPPSQTPKLFDNERDAAAALARSIVDTGSTSVMRSSSCFHPEEYGRPKFNSEDFDGLIRIEIKKLMRIQEFERQYWTLIGKFKGGWSLISLYQKVDGTFVRETEDLRTGTTTRAETSDGSAARVDFIVDANSLLCSKKPPMPYDA